MGLAAIGAMLPMLTPGGEDAGVLLHAAGGLSVVALERRDESWRAGKPIALGRGGPAEAVQAVASLEAMPGPTTSAGGVLDPIPSSYGEHARLFASGVCLPSGSNLTDAEIGRVIGHLRRLLAQSSTQHAVS